MIITDSLVLHQLITQVVDLKDETQHSDYIHCYQPQVQMRMVFTLYAINSAGICFILTVGLMLWDEISEEFERFVGYIMTYMLFAFGPVMLVLCCIGLAQAYKIDDECSYDQLAWELNLVDMIILVVCLLVSAIVTFCFALMRTLAYVDEALQSEMSMFYRYFQDRLKKRIQ